MTPTNDHSQNKLLMSIILAIAGFLAVVVFYNASRVASLEARFEAEKETRALLDLLNDKRMDRMEDEHKETIKEMREHGWDIKGNK